MTMRGVALALVCAVAGCRGSDARPAETHAADVPLPAASVLHDEIERRLPDRPLLRGGTLRIVRLDRRMIVIEYTTSDRAPDLRSPEAERSSELLVSLAVRVLVAHGYDPHERHTRIDATVQQRLLPAYTETWESYGDAFYDPDADRVEPPMPVVEWRGPRSGDAGTP
jgi:hypothetical protein